MVDVDRLDPEDRVRLDSPHFDGAYEVADTDMASLGLFELPVAVIVKDDEQYTVIGNCHDTEGRTVEVRTPDDRRVCRLFPEDITRL